MLPFLLSLVFIEVCNVKIRRRYNPNNPVAKFSKSVAVTWRGAGHYARSTVDLREIPELSNFERKHLRHLFSENVLYYKNVDVDVAGETGQKRKRTGTGRKRKRTGTGQKRKRSSTIQVLVPTITNRSKEANDELDRYASHYTVI